MPQKACRLHNSRLELAVTVHSVVNLDLCSQGWYAVRITAHPIGEYVQASLTSCTRAADTIHNLIEEPERLGSTFNEHSMRSRVFLIRYIQQKVALGHTVCFALSQAAEQVSTPVSCTLEVELLYQPLTHCRSVDPPQDLHLTVLDKQKFLLSSCEQGLHAFQPVTFVVPNLALCSISVHTCTLQQGVEQLTVRPSDDFEGDVDCQPSQYIRSALSQCWGTPKGQPLPHSGQQTKPAAAPSPDSQEHYSSTGAEAHVRHLQASSRTLSNSTVIDLPLESTSNSLLQPVQQFEADHFSQHVDNGSSQHNGQPVAKEPSQQALDQSVLHRLSQQDASQSAFWVAGPAGQHAAAQSDQQLADQTVQHGSGFSGEPYDTLTNHHHHNSSLPLLTQSGTEGVWREHGQQELSHRTRSGSHAHKAGGFTSLQEYGFQALPVCGEDYTEAQALSSADLVCGMSQTNKAVLDGIRLASTASLHSSGVTRHEPTGAMKKSAEALSSVLDSLVGSKHYAHMQHMRNSTLTNPNLTPASHVTAHGIPATSPRHQSATANSHIGSALIAALKHACDAPVPDSQHNPPDTPVPDSHHSSAARLPRHEHFAAAYAADWACLMWLLQTAPEEVIIALRAKWQEHQAQEFAMWVRPASELNPVRNKAAAKVMRQQLRELSVTSRHSSITQAIPRSSPSTALSPSAAGPHRLQLSPGVMQTLTDQRSPLRAAGAAGTPNSWAGSSPAVQSSSPSKVWGESTPPLHPSSPKGGLSVLRKLRWGKAPGQGSLLVPQVSSASGNANRGLLDSSVQGQAAVHFSETSRDRGHGQDLPSNPQLTSPSRFWSVLSPGVQSRQGSRTWGGVTPLIQSASPSKTWGTGTPLIQSTSASRNWGTGTSLIQSTSPSKNWGTGTPLVQSSSPSRVWGVGGGTPPVQSSAPSFLRGWLSKQRGRSVVEEQAMQAFRLQLALGGRQAMPAGPSIQDQRLHEKPHHQPILFVNDSLAPDLQPVLPHATQSLDNMYGASTSPKKQAAKPSALRSALNAMSKSFSAYHKRPAKGVAQHDSASDTVSSQPDMHHSYSAGQPDWMLQSRHASIDLRPEDLYVSTEDVQLLGGAEGNFVVKLPLRSTASCPTMSPVAHTRSSLMHSLSRSGMSHSPKQLATTRRRGTLAPRIGITAEYDAADVQTMPVSGSTPTAAEVSMLQAAAFQAALDHQQARQHTPLAVTAPTSAAVALTPAAVPLAPAAVVLAPAAVAPMPAAASHAAANSGVTAVALSLANQERFCCQQCASEAPPPSCVTAVEQQPLLMSTVFSDQQTLSPSHSQSSPVVPVGLAALSDLDGIDLEIECDGQAPNSALLLPVAPADSAHSRLLPHTARLPLGVSYLTARAAGTSDEQSAGCEESGSVLSRPQMHIPSDTQAHIFPDAQMHIPPDTALAEDAAPLLTDREHDATTNPTSAAEAGIASAQSADRRQQQQPGGNPQIGSSVRSAMRDTLTLESPEQHWYQHGSLAASTAASDSSHDTPRDATDSKLPASASAAKHAADGDVLECCRSLGSPALSLHPLGHFHMAPSELPSLASGTVAGNPAPIEQPSTAAMAAQDQEADNGAVKEKQPAVSRVMSKLHSLQSMTHRLRSQSQRVLQPVAWQTSSELSCISEADHKQAAAVTARPPLHAEAHVVVFVHGFRGSARDLGAVRSHMQLAQPELDFLMSKVNQERTSDGVQIMGHRLAQEVVQYLQEHDVGKQRQLGKLSFVGHSLGNVIIRAALTEPCLKPYLGRMWLFVSLSGPHLGYLCAPNKLFCSGMWLFKKFTAGRTLHELTFTDAPRLEDCYLYKLAALPSLIHFKCVLLTASPQDQYVPFDSTRVQSPQKKHQGPRASAQKKMARQILSNIGRPGGTQLIRVDVDFPVKQWESVNNAVGRTAHLAFVESEVFIRFLVWSVLHAKQLL